MKLLKCQKCPEDNNMKPADRFGITQTGRKKPICKDCYNAKARIVREEKANPVVVRDMFMQPTIRQGGRVHYY